MKLLLTDAEIEMLVYNCFVNDGLSEIGHSDIELVFIEEDYTTAKQTWIKNNNNSEPCYEDILVQLWTEGKLHFYDHNEEKKVEFTVSTVKQKLTSVLASKKVNEKAITEVLDILTKEGNADAWTGFNVLQFMLFGEIIYG